MLGRNIFACVRIGLALFLIVFFAIMPVGWPDGVSICAFSNIMGMPCPGCGGTRAFASVVHLQLSDAFAYNPVVATFLVPLFFLLLVNDVYCLMARLRSKHEARSWIEYVIFGEMARTMIGGDR